MSDAGERLDNKSPDELERDIEETRARISEEMSALGYKLGPEGLRDSAEDALKDTQDTVVSVTEQLKKGVIESSDSIGGRLSAFIKENPIPATLFGVGLAWLLKQGQSSRGAHPERARSSARGASKDSREDASTYREGPSRSASNDNARGSTVVANVPDAGRERARASVARSDEDEAFRSHHESNYSANGDFEEYEPAYRYGFDLASEDAFKGKPWSDARNDAKRRWDEERNEPWFKFDGAVEHGYKAAQSRR